ncbi:NUDIX hydrolase [Novosphingobium terrae]|uniref:ADP-ribose pyrophosphatase n=1 Tax=Novosphingobium terrae TaxID=2726189 RepID=UPI00197E03A1|nr:ADP-ribose pyrophosphatase [Novosphingobium terrae]
MTQARITNQTLIYDGWYRFSRLEVEMPDGVRVERHLIDNGSAAAVLPYDPVRRVCMLIEQPRAGVLAAGEAPLLEAIAGNLGGMAPDKRIIEEALEEGGLRISELEPVTNMWSLCPVSTERIQLYLTPYSSEDRIGEGGGALHEDENITVHEITLDHLRDLVLAGELTDAKTLILAQALLLRRPELWAASQD